MIWHLWNIPPSTCSIYIYFSSSDGMLNGIGYILGHKTRQILTDVELLMIKNMLLDQNGNKLEINN